MKKLTILLLSLLVVIGLFGCQSTEEKIEKHLSNNECLEAYELALKTEDKEIIENTILRWQETILKNEVIDPNFTGLKITKEENKDKFGENILNYMFEKQKLNNDQLDLLFSLLNGVEEIYWANKNVMKVYLSLKQYSNDERIWIVEERNPLSYEEYFSKEHTYDEKSKTAIKGKEKEYYYSVVIDEMGMAISLADKKQYVLFGDFKDYTYLASDGYWIYCAVGKDLMRISIESEKEVLFTFAEKIELNTENVEYSSEMEFIDYDIILFKEIIDDTLYIHRLYVPDKKLDTFETGLTADEYRLFGFGNWINVKYDYFEESRLSQELKSQTSSSHILFYAVNPEYIGKVEELKQNPELCYKLYRKYLYVDSEDEMKEEMTEAFENPFDYSIYGVKKLVWIIENEYKVNRYVNYVIDVSTKEIKMTYIDPVITVEGFPY